MTTAKTAEKAVIKTTDAPSAIGPYSQAIRCGGFIFCSGQIALDPAQGRIVEGDVAAQTRQVLNNLNAVLAAAGCTFGDVVKTTIFLKDMNDFQRVNQVYGEFFVSEPPARSTVEVARLPREVLVEIEAIAHVSA